VEVRRREMEDRRQKSEVGRWEMGDGRLDKLWYKTSIRQ
jgi:hypothetical protein